MTAASVVTGVRRAHRTGVVVALAAVVAMLVVAGCQKRGPDAGGSGDMELRPVGALRVGVRNRPVPPTVGDNTLVVTLRDSTGAPARGAAIDMLAVMEAMGQMPRMESRGEVRETGPGVYEAKYGLSMSGEWDLRLRIRDAGGTAVEADYRISTTLTDIAYAGGEDVDGAVRIDPARRQAIGIRTAPVEARDLRVTVRAAGRVAYDETRRAEVSLKFGGWVRDLHVDYTGRAVQQGEALFTAYSPELFAAQQEFLVALGAGDADTSAAGRPDAGLVRAARQRLLLWDIAPGDIDAIARAGRPMEAVPITSPAAGVIVEKSVVKGSAFMAGQTLYRIAPVHPVWVVANVYPFELSLLRTGMTASILTPFLPEQSRPGRVAYVSPFLETETRTGEVRLDVPNGRGDLKPGMFVDVKLDVALGRRLAVPNDAVLHVGDRRVVFVDIGDGRLAPRDVTLGARAGDWYEVRGGLREGEIVVVSGNFLVAAESRLKSAEQKW